MKKIYFLLAMIMAVSIGWGQAILTNGSPSLTIDFSNTTPTGVGSNPSTAFAGAGFEPNTVTAGRLNSNAWAVTGWSNGALTFGGTQTTASTDYTRGSTAIAVTTGGMYAYTGAPASVANPILMIQPGGSDWDPGTLTLRVQNNGTTNITELAVSYNIYVRNDQARSNSFNFSHSADDVTYTAVGALDYSSIEVADGLNWVLVGTAPSRTTTITGLNIVPGGYYYIRWSGAFVSGSGSRDEFGLDDINLTGTFAAAAAGTATITAGAGSEPATISSLVNTQGAASLNFDFTVNEDGATNDADPTLISQIVINQGTNNDALLANWTQAIAGAELFDGTTTVTGVVNSSNITFASLANTNPGDFGHVADNGSKTYTLRIWLNASLGGTLPTTIDGKQFEFLIQSSGVSTAGAGSSGIAASQSVSSGLSTNVVSVIATQLVFVQNTTSPTGVSTAMTPAPTISANDANANRDLDFTSFVEMTSTGTLLGTPVSVQAVAGLSTFSGAIIHTATGTGLQLTAAYTGLTSATSNLFNIQAASSATDYFQSVGSGDWNSPLIWESSADNITWVPSTLAPTAAANVITIRNGHTVTITTSAGADQVEIQNGGTLVNGATTGNTYTIADDGTAAPDLSIKPGGVYQITSSLGYASYQTINTGATIRIEGGGIIRFGTGGTLGGSANNSFVTTGTTYIWDSGSIFDWNATSIPGATGVTYFPDAAAGTIPVLRFSATPSGNIGGGTALTVNGLLEANTAITFAGNGNKNFRDGIIGTGNIGYATGTGKFVINGTTAVLGGTGTLTNPNGIDIGTGTTLTMVSAKSITGNLTLLADSYIELGAFNLSVSGQVNGGAVNAYVRTTGAGALVRSVSAAGDYQFPVGSATKYQEFTINFAAPLGAANTLAARFVSGEGGLNGLPLSESGDNINRISPEGYWEVNAGAPFADAYTGTFVARNFNGVLDYSKLHLLKRTDAVSPWTLDGTHVPTTGTNALATLQRTGMSGFSQFAAGGELNIALPVKFSNVKAYQQGSGIKVEWSNLTESNVADYKVERSIAGQSFAALTTVLAAKNDGGRADYSFIDALPVNGVNLYRIQATEADGQKLYSVIVRVDTRGGITTITVYPNPVTAGQLSLQATELPKGLYNVQVYNAAGQQVHSQQLNHNGGSVTEMIQLPASLRSGMYNLHLSNGEVKLGKTFIVR